MTINPKQGTFFIHGEYCLQNLKNPWNTYISYLEISVNFCSTARYSKPFIKAYLLLIPFIIIIIIIIVPINTNATVTHHIK